MRPDRIETARLTLRRARTADLDALHQIFRDPSAMRYWSEPPHPDLAHTQAWLDRMLTSSDDDFLIEHQGRVVGKAGMWRRPEVGFLLAPSLWRRGLMAEAMQAVIDHLFAHHDLDHLTAEADPRNAGSLGLLAKLGFHETHRAQNTMQWGEEWCDSVYLRLDRSTWPKARESAFPAAPSTKR
jgi:[ribosomal protein S5]-alanine N-acetyltransferase